MTFENIFNEMCRHYNRKPVRFITVSGKTFKSITARRLMNNCLKSQHQVVLSAYADYGNSKVCDFFTHFTSSDSDPENGNCFCYENNFVIIFVKGE